MARQDRIEIQTLLFRGAGLLLGCPVPARRQHPLQQINARIPYDIEFIIRRPQSASGGTPDPRRGTPATIAITGSVSESAGKRTRSPNVEKGLRLARNMQVDAMAKTLTSPFDVADYLCTPEDMAAHWEASIEEADGDATFVAGALGGIARAKGMPQVARDAGLSRESLQDAFSTRMSPV